MATNGGCEHREQLGDDADGRPLVTYLATRYRHSSAPEWREQIARGLVLLDREPAEASAILRRGQTLSWHRPGWEEPAAPCRYDVLYRDAELLAVFKPAGLPVLPGGGFMDSTLLALVRREDSTASPVHRLGRGTSGVVLFARTRDARAALSRQWAERSVYKRYRALASGRPERDSFAIDVPIGPVPYAPLGSVHAANTAGKPAMSHVVVRERGASSFVCDVTIATGRPHQIRIHLAAAGHPLVGDPLYRTGGRPAPGADALPGDLGYLLHAAELAVDQPRTGERITIQCAPPPALAAGPDRAVTIRPANHATTR